MSNRILDYPEATEITSNDYILLDNEGTGAKCIKASALNINMDNYTIKEARGAIASFDDGEDLPLAFMGAYITAIQDLHGYDYPWVGGSGKNKFDLDTVASFIKNGIVSTQGLTNQDGVITNSKSYGGDGIFPFNYPMTFSSNTITVSADIKLSGNHSSNNVFIQMFDSNGSEKIADGEVTMSSKDTWEHKTITLQLSLLTNVNLAIEARGTNNSVQIKNVQVEVGSTATTYAPYSNECPISGWDEVNVTRCGKNLFCEDFTKYTKPDNYYILPIKMPVGTSFTFKATKTGNAISGIIVGYARDGDRYSNFVGQSNVIDSSGNTYTRTFTADDTYKNPKLIFYGNATNFAEVLANYEIQLEIGSETAYSPYNGNTYSLTFTDGTNPLTVYYGTVDLISGELVVNVPQSMKIKISSLNWTYQSNTSRFRADLPTGAKKPSTSSEIPQYFNCECYRPNNYLSYTNGDITITSSGDIFVKDNNFTDTTTWLNTVGDYCVTFPLATPLTYSLTKQQIRSLVGENNIFADTGDSVVDYRKLWVMPEM